MNKIVLIGGAPTLGKSFIARKIANELGLPWISTDTIREQMRLIVRREDYSDLFSFSDSTSKMAIKFLNENSSSEIVFKQNKESENVWKGVKAIIETDYVWESFIIEGIALLPKCIKELKTEKKIIAVFLTSNNLNKIRKVIFTRGLWDDADKYPDTVKEKEVEWVVAYNNWIISEAEKYNFQLINIDNENYYEKIKNIIENF